MSKIPDEYFSVAHSGQAELREKASRFFGFAEQVTDEEAALVMRARLKKQYHDAAHQPCAFRLSAGSERSSDDGEPRSTSGPAILTEIQRADLYDVQVIVVRYFGGVKLGKGGLSRAFAECARLTLDDAGRRQVQRTDFLTLDLPPDQVNVVKTIAAEYHATVSTISYDVQAHVRFVLPSSRLQDCRETLLRRFGVAIFTDRL